LTDLNHCAKGINFVVLENKSFFYCDVWLGTNWQWSCFL